MKQKGLKVILFSNSCCLLNSTISTEVLNLVDDVFYSYNLGFTKNDNESYNYIEKNIACLLGEFLHIGDTLSSDYLIPIKNGWNALFYGVAKDKTIKYIINLSDILKYLD